MFVSAIILCLLALMLIFFYRSNKFVRIVGMYFLIIAVNLVVGNLYLSRVTFYSAGNGIEYWFFSKIVQLRISHTTVVRIFNAAFSAYMFGAVWFVNYLKKLPWWCMGILLIPTVYLYIFNDPNVGRYLHIEMNAGAGVKCQFLEQFILWSNLWNRIMIIIYLIMPIVVIFISYRKSAIWVRKKDLMISAICITIINVYIYFLLINGIYKNIMFDNVNFVRLPLEYMQRDYNDVLLNITWGAILSIVLLILLLKPYAIFDKGNSFTKKRAWKQLNKNLEMTLHSYKNAFLGISQQFKLAEININKEEYSKALSNIEKGKTITSDYIFALENTLRFLKNIHVEFIPVNLVNCIKNVMERVASTKDIILELQCDNDEIMIKGDQYHITEMVLNLLLNAIQAVASKKDVQPYVFVKVYVEDEMVMLEVRDNGVGIKKKNLYKIFQPFFSTKSEASGGVGLNYVLNIVKQHRGRIRVLSKEGEYTSFQVVFSVYNQKRNIFKKRNVYE